MKKTSYIPYIAGALVLGLAAAGGIKAYNIVKQETTVDTTMVETVMEKHEAEPVVTTDAPKTAGINIVTPENTERKEITPRETALPYDPSGTGLSAYEIAERAEIKSSKDIIIDQNGDTSERRGADSTEEHSENEREKEDTRKEEEIDRTTEAPQSQTTEPHSESIEEETYFNKYEVIPDLNLAFDQYMRRMIPEHYSTGEFTEHGVNQFGMKDTTGECAIATVMNSLFNTTAYTENAVLKKTMESNNCSLTGAQNTAQVSAVLTGMGEYTEDKIATEISKGTGLPSAAELWWFVNKGGKVIVPVRLYDGQDGNKAVQWGVITGAAQGGFRLVTTTDRIQTITGEQLSGILGSLGVEPEIICVLRA